MGKDLNCITHSTKANDFTITLSQGMKENNERVSFLEQQVQQAKEAYQATLKTVIKECISLEIQAKKEETEFIMDLLPVISSAIQTLQGTDCDKHLQTINVLAMSPNLLQFGLIASPVEFLGFYQNHHSLDAIPKASFAMLDAEYPTIKECTKALGFASKRENLAITMYIKCLETICHHSYNLL